MKGCEGQRGEDHVVTRTFRPTIAAMDAPRWVTLRGIGFPTLGLKGPLPDVAA